ncbi:hypothetical protein PHLCEN_2v7962 [Hermanssonia centrifuga]|uniref:Uncharacterized protein n=1 Tax=Hermanssonia centrifuga TaxID=98765 RepID=A0A2R6NV04_9APHY|nr:hypothetical protein PHLCEN_2v7962 [Hermanssonia centrifuga]
MVAFGVGLYSESIFAAPQHTVECSAHRFILFSALRVYALWYPNILLTYLVLGLNLVPIVTNIISYSYAPITYADSICSQSNTLSAGANLRYV